ncbi:MAG: exo-beta-N-acetylmuramidase NamZ domain-containing protein, partial [Anaerolineae bacterium]
MTLVRLFTFLSFFCLLHLKLFAEPQVKLGIDRFFDEGVYKCLSGKRVGLVTNHTGVDGQLRRTIDLFLLESRDFSLAAVFAPEHGLYGIAYADEKIEHGKLGISLPVYSLHGETRRPTKEMLKDLHVLIYDMQDIGSRSYTYATTLFYAMEAAAKEGVSVIVLDRPNPIGGLLVDGPMLEEKWRSFLGYINVPYCHGMTVGELARFFNEEYKIGCELTVVPMKGWNRSMTFGETGLHWIPTSPYIPEEDTPFFYASTGILGALGWVNIGIGYTQPFKLVGAPWIDADHFAEQLNAQKLPGTFFVP